MTKDKSFLTYLEVYGGTVTFEDRCLAHMKGKWIIFIPDYTKLDGILYVDGLKTNLLQISQTYAKIIGWISAKTYVRELIKKEKSLSQDIG